ncbi:MAG: VOC family protein [Solirubrobacteraceae bacterium]
MPVPPEINDPEELEARGAPASATIAASTSLGPVHLTVADLARSVAYYERAVGLTLLDGGPGGTSSTSGMPTSPAGRRAVLGVGERALLVLVEQPGARPVTHSTGLYHFALLVPRRVDLARWLAHAAHERVALAGLSDHFVSEAVYLSDPDGHGIEIYWDRPRAHWEGQVAVRMTTLPLDVESLLAELPDRHAPDFRGLSAGTVMGHVHLKVAAVPQAIAFYRDVLGFALMAALGDSAAFLSAGGYHHHIGANTWESAGASPPPAGAATLRHATIVLPDETERERVLARVAAHGYALHHGEEGPLVHDRSGNALVLSVAKGP